MNEPGAGAELCGSACYISAGLAHPQTPFCARTAPTLGQERPPCPVPRVPYPVSSDRLRLISILSVDRRIAPARPIPVFPFVSEGKAHGHEGSGRGYTHLGLRN
jgi:hypothetical protein